MNIKPNALVRNSRADFGVGRLIARDAKHVHVFFPSKSGDEAVRFSAATPLEEVQPDGSPLAQWLQNLPAFSWNGNRWVLSKGVMTHEQAVERFLRHFPKGFKDPAFSEHERGYKFAAHETWVKTLASGQAEALIAAGDFEGLRDRMKKVLSGLNLLSVFENSALGDGLKDSERARAYLLAVVRFAQGPDAGTEAAFEALVAATAALPAKGSRVLTWPIVTIFPFLAAPDRHIFVKPGVTKAAGDRMAFELHYQSTPNWRTYSAVLELTELLARRLEPLGPRDFIDAQTFMWIVCQEEEGATDSASE